LDHPFSGVLLTISNQAVCWRLASIPTNGHTLLGNGKRGLD